MDEADKKRAEKLARFKADPVRVRVSIRRCGSQTKGWHATVAHRQTGQIFAALSVDPEEAVNRALHKAEVEGMDGIDLDMARAYAHPQR